MVKVRIRIRARLGFRLESRLGLGLWLQTVKKNSRDSFWVRKTMNPIFEQK